MSVLRVFLVCALITGLLAAPAAAEKIKLQAGESTIVGGVLLLEFVDVPHDSRCPIDVTCFWEGDGVVRIRKDHPRTGEDEFNLHTFRDFGRAVEIDGYRVELLDLEPDPLNRVIIDPEDYVATLNIEKSGTVQSPAVSWTTLKTRY